MLRIFSAVLLVCIFFVGTAQAAGKPLVVASDATWPPMEYLDDQKIVVGYSTDYIRAVAKAAGLEVVLRNVAWDGIFAGVAAGHFDIIASSVTITPERQKQFAFTEPYCEVRQAVLVRTDTPIKTLTELKGKKVGGQIGTTGIFVLYNAKLGAEVREYEDVGLAMEDLANGRIEAVMCDDPVAKYYANKHAGFAKKFMVALVTPDAEYYGFTLKQGNGTLVKQLNQGIKMVKENGTEKALQKKWMGVE